MPVYLVSYHTHISRMIYDIMRSVYKLVVYSHMNLVRNPRQDRMYFVYYMCMTHLDDHDMRARSPIRMMRRNRS